MLRYSLTVIADLDVAHSHRLCSQWPVGDVAEDEAAAEEGVGVGVDPGDNREVSLSQSAVCTFFFFFF